MVVVAIIGVLAAIAIPAFNKSVRRSKTSEALLSLRKIFDGSVAYFAQDRTNPHGDVVPHQFPRTVPATPGAPPPGRKAVPEPGDWDHPTWQALSFAVSDPYYYTYSYGSEGTSGSAKFTGAAFGDLDGDGHYSTFLRGGTIRDHEVRGFAGIYRVRELE